MRNIRTIIFLIVWLTLATVTILFVPPNLGFVFGSSFLLIAILVVSRDLWKASSKFGFALIRRPSAHDAKQDNLSRAAFNVKNAIGGSPYNRREVAEILREALLRKYHDTRSFPTSWIATEYGNQAIVSILKSKASEDLVDTFSLPDITGKRKSPKDKEQYLSKLDKALRLIEE
jgi:hypothetical protein